MTLLIGFLSFVLVLNCLFLVLLVLIQLPKKEAGAGVAFGASTTDALFGAGSGNALTKATRYAATFFVGMAIVLSLLWSRQAGSASRRLEQAIQQQTSTPPPVQLPTGTNPLSVNPAPLTISTNLPGSPANQATNAPVAVTNQTPATQQTPAVEPAPATTPAPATPDPAPPQTPAPNPQ